MSDTAIAKVVTDQDSLDFLMGSFIKWLMSQYLWTRQATGSKFGTHEEYIWGYGSVKPHIHMCLCMSIVMSFSKVVHSNVKSNRYKLMLGK